MNTHASLTFRRYGTLKSSTYQFIGEMAKYYLNFWPWESQAAETSTDKNRRQCEESLRYR